MERQIYLLRHGETERVGKKRCCLSRTDLRLSDRGRSQAAEAGRWLSEKNIRKIYSSPLSRCVETAEIVQMICGGSKSGVGDQNPVQIEEITVCDEFQEMSVGEWENISFSEIQMRYPKEYEERGRQLGFYAPPGGESFSQAGVRFEHCLEQICKKSEGNILIVAHAGVIRGYLCRILGISPNRVFELPQPYAGVTVLNEKLGEERKISVQKVGYRSIKFLDNEEIQLLYKKCQTPKQIIRHMQAVAGYIEEMARKFPKMFSDPEAKDILVKAALVHDIARTEKNHAEQGAQILEKEGYYEVAKLVRTHHGTEDICNGETKWSDDKFTLAEILFYADKKVKGDRIVSIEERFDASLRKCQSPEAVENHHRQYEMAKEIERKFFEMEEK